MYILGIIFSVTFLIIILNLIKNKKIEANYSIFWKFFSIGLLLITIIPKIIIKIANKLKFSYYPSFIFLGLITILLIYCLILTINFTKNRRLIINLTKEISELKQKVNKD